MRLPEERLGVRGIGARIHEDRVRLDARAVVDAQVEHLEGAGVEDAAQQVVDAHFRGDQLGTLAARARPGNGSGDAAHRNVHREGGIRRGDAARQLDLAGDRHAAAALRRAHGEAPRVVTARRAAVVLDALEGLDRGIALGQREVGDERAPFRRRRGARRSDARGAVAQELLVERGARGERGCDDLGAALELRARLREAIALEADPAGDGQDEGRCEDDPRDGPAKRRAVAVRAEAVPGRPRRVSGLHTRIVEARAPWPK